MNKDHIEGAFTEAKGNVKEAVGGLTGDGKTQAEGKVDELTGQAQQAWGDARETIEAAAADATETPRPTSAAARPRPLRDNRRDREGQGRSQVGSKVYEAGATAGQLRRQHGAGAAAAHPLRCRGDRLSRRLSCAFAVQPLRP